MRDLRIDRYADGSSFIHRLDPRGKILGLMVLVTAQVLTNPRHIWTFALHAAVLLSLVALSRIPWRFAAARFALIVPFVLLVAAFAPFLPTDTGSGTTAVLEGQESVHSGWIVFLNAALKGSLGVLALIVLSSTTRFSDLLKGLEKLRMPHIFILILGIAYRYIYVFVDEAASLTRAMRCRGFRGRWIWQSAMLGRLLGNLFLRAYERGERVHMAMVSRGFEGTVRATRPLSFHRVDAVFVAVMVLVALAGQALRLLNGGSP